MHFLRTHSPKILRYLFSGGVGAASNIAILFILVTLHMYYLFAAVVAFILATGVSFIMQKFWTFQNNQVETVHLQIPIFIGAALMNLVVNTLIMLMLVGHFHVWYLLAQIIASGVIASYSFFVYKFFIFT